MKSIIALVLACALIALVLPTSSASAQTSLSFGLATGGGGTAVAAGFSTGSYWDHGNYGRVQIVAPPPYRRYVAQPNYYWVQAPSREYYYVPQAQLQVVNVTPICTGFTYWSPTRGQCVVVGNPAPTTIIQEQPVTNGYTEIITHSSTHRHTERVRSETHLEPAAPFRHPPLTPSDRVHVEGAFKSL